MKQYRIVYNDKSVEYIEAYGCHREGAKVTFDLGHHKTFVANGVKHVEELWDDRKDEQE